MSLLVDNPILNSPFEEPSRYWEYREGQPVLAEGRRPAGYYLKARTRGEHAALFEEEFVPLETVNMIRKRVRAWREKGYPGTTAITRQLLRHWKEPERERKLFFCQREAAETLIWLVEAPAADKQGIDIPKDNGLTRYLCKMATGSGKTVVMGMLIAWQVLNKMVAPQDRRFSDAVLLVCPNLTIRSRLQVLLPWQEGNYYEKFELVPRGLMPRLQQARFVITNWHVFQPADDTRSRNVLQRGPESPTAFCRRVLGDLGNKANILVINDEAHHAYRPAPLPEETKSELTKEEVAEREEATIWVSGLETIAAGRGINFCADFSATPFYIKGSGYPEGEPLPWIVSDFGLVDAIESGIVKIPRVPVDDNTGAPVPKYFRLWQTINSQLAASERQTARRKAKPESVLREAEGALATLASEWKKTFEAFQRAGSPVPPVMIIVCDNTNLAKLVHDHIAGGNILPELSNSQSTWTFRIDSKLLTEAKTTAQGETKTEAAEKLRLIVDTVGKLEWQGEGDPPGKDIRCVVSVGMLNEGWDASNVTQILGLRAFTSQLLCEQVVGRGLRRMNYDDFTEPEYVDVYGVPFEVIPVKKKSLSRTEDIPRLSTLVRALPERKALEIRFPRVEGYIMDVRSRIRIDLETIPYLEIGGDEPTEVVVKPQVGLRLGRPDRLGPGSEVVHDRCPFHRGKRLQATVYEIAAELTRRLTEKRPQWGARHILFPQVLEAVWRYLEERVRVVSETEVPLEEVALLKYKQRIIERIGEAIEPDEEAGEPPLLPVIEQFRPMGSTSEVLFRTLRPCVGTTKSHISHVVLDAPQWEHSVAYQLERIEQVIAYARNERLDFTIPYEYEGEKHEYRPDFLVRWRGDDGNIVHVILEVKGFETERDRQKQSAAQRWVRAVNHWGECGRWAFAVCLRPDQTREVLSAAATPPVRRALSGTVAGA